MAGVLASRIDKLAAKLPPAAASRRVVRIVANKGDETAALELAKSNGYDPSNEGDFLILRSLVTPAGQTVKACEPYMS